MLYEKLANFIKTVGWWALELTLVVEQVTLLNLFCTAGSRLIKVE